MKITPIKFENNKTTISENKITPNHDMILSAQSSGADKFMSNVYYLPINIKNAFVPNFQGLTIERDVIKKVLGKKSQGIGIYTDSKNYIDFNKISSELLATEPLDITKATNNEVTAYRFSKALAEGMEVSWTRRYNPFNRRSPLAVSHSLNSKRAQRRFVSNLELLFNDVRGKSLDIDVTDEKGNLKLDCVVFDTETTGTSIKDKIIQMAAVQVKNGKIVEGEQGVYNQLINPEVHIPEEASAVNGITDDMVAKAPTIEAVLEKFLKLRLNKENGAIVAYNHNFDVPLLNRNIRQFNSSTNNTLKERPIFKTLDPYILIQRIHPFVGARKRLSQQYQWIFCKEMENAHDALADVKGTIDMLKYCLYYLSEHRKDKTVPLTLREVLVFQNGGTIENTTLKLHDTNNFNADVNFSTSYRYSPFNVDNYFDGYKLTKQKLNELAPQIGEANAAKLRGDVVDTMIDLNQNGKPINPAETKRKPKSKGFEDAAYVMETNMRKLLGFAKLEGFNGMSKEEIENLIIEESKHYLHNDIVNIWHKNINPKDIRDGNDLPDIEIARRVMRENQAV